jgi:cytochrome c oxidase subunit 2
VPIPAAILTVGLSVVLVLIGLWVGQNVNLLPIDASANAPVYDELFQVLFSIGTSLLLGIVGLLIYSLIRYRRVAGDTSDGDLEACEEAVPEKRRLVAQRSSARR